MTTLNELATDFLAQKRIAVVGVRRSTEDAANAIYKTLKERGHEVFPVNPNAQTFQGDPCYPNVQAIPGGVDGVVIATRPEITEQVVKDCAEAGVRRVWMHDNTFVPGSRSDEAVQFCKDHGIAVIGGACPMMWMDFGHKCMRAVLGLMGRLPNPN
jgi:predicted CoA-binding protein